MSGYVPLAGAIIAEIIATVTLRGAARQGTWWQWAIVVTGYVTAFALLSVALRTIGVGTAYAIWSGVGTAGVAIIAWLLFEKRLTPVAILGIILVIIGVVLLHVGGYHPASERP